MRIASLNRLKVRCSARHNFLPNYTPARRYHLIKDVTKELDSLPVWPPLKVEDNLVCGMRKTWQRQQQSIYWSPFLWGMVVAIPCYSAAQYSMYSVHEPKHPYYKGCVFSTTTNTVVVGCSVCVFVSPSLSLILSCKCPLFFLVHLMEPAKQTLHFYLINPSEKP